MSDALTKNDLKLLKTDLLSVMEKTHKEAKGTERAFSDILSLTEKIGKSLETKLGHAVGSMLGMKKGFKDYLTNIAEGISGENTVIKKLVKENIDVSLKMLSSPNDPKLKAYSKALSSQIRFYSRVKSEVESVVKSEFYAPAVVEAWALAYKYVEKTNQALINTSGEFTKRALLFKDIAMAQVMTGSATDEVLDAMRAITDRGFQFRSGMADSLAIMLKMKDGLGVTFETSAELMAVYKNINAPINQAADGIARIRSETALSAEEATKFYTEFGRIINMINPAGSRFATENSEYLSKLAGIYKELGGNAGDVMALTKSLSSSNMGMGMMLGGPGGMTSDKGSQVTMENLYKYLKPMLDSAGNNQMAREAILEAVSQQTGASKELLANLGTILKKTKERPTALTDLSTEWQRQTATVGQQLSMLKDRLYGLLMGGLYLPMMALGKVLSVVNWALNQIVKFKPVMYALGTVIGIIVVTATARLTKKMFELALALELAARAANRAILAQAGGDVSQLANKSITKIIPYASKMTSFLSRSAMFLGRISIWTAVLVAVFQGTMSLFKKYYDHKIAKENQREAKYKTLTSSIRRNREADELMQAHSSQILERGGSLTDKQVKDQLSLKATHGAELLTGALGTSKVAGKPLTDEQARTASIKYANKIIKDAEDADTKSLAAFDAKYKGKLTPKEEQERKQMADHLKALLESNDLANELAKKMLDSYNKQTDTIERHKKEKEAAEEADAVQRSLMMSPMMM